MNVLDLFSGIGGFSLGLERAGMRTVAFCEIDPYCRAVLAARWPGVPIFGDIREIAVHQGRLVADAAGSGCEGVGGSGKTRTAECRVDVICGGFPCQDISYAGEGAGLAGARSGLWSEYARLIGELRPQWVIVENVSALLGRGLGDVLADLASIGYDAEWHCIPASYVGAPHRRDRIWIAAYPNDQWEPQSQGSERQGRRWSSDSGQEVAHTARRGRLQGHQDTRGREAGTGTAEAEEWRGSTDGGWWEFEPDVGRVANGIPARSHRLRALGNAVVPQVVEMIGRAVMRAHGEGLAHD